MSFRVWLVQLSDRPVGNGEGGGGQVNFSQLVLHFTQHKVFLPAVLWFGEIKDQSLSIRAKRLLKLKLKQ